MTSKEIEDGADTTLITELDEAAESRIIDVLSKVFVTNKYPGLRAAMIDGIERHRQKKEMEERQWRQQNLFDNQKYMADARLQSGLGNHHNSLEQDMAISRIKEEMEKQKAAVAKQAPAPFMNPFSKLFMK